MSVQRKWGRWGLAQVRSRLLLSHPPQFGHFPPQFPEELWVNYLKKPYSIHNQKWPVVDKEAAEEEEITLIIQVNGKVRDRIVVSANITEQEAKELALSSDNATRFFEGNKPRKVIYIPGRLVNIVA